MSLAAGTKLGPYEIQTALGAGGMGEVYRARDTRLERTVAVKILPSHLSSNPEAKQRFEREARTISSLNHPHICVLHDVGSQDGTSYLVDSSQKMTAVDIQTANDSVQIGAPKTLFQTGVRTSIFSEGYDVTRDGRFLVVNSVVESTAPLVLVTSWDAELKK